MLNANSRTDDTGAACRGAINMRIASLNLDVDDKLRLEIRGKASVKYHLKANHEVEAKRWYWALNNAIQWTKDEDKEEQKRLKHDTEELRRAKMEQLERAKTTGSEAGSVHSKTSKGLTPSTALGVPVTSGQSAPASSTAVDEDGGNSFEPSIAGNDLARSVSHANTATMEGDMDDDEEYGDDASSHEAHPLNKDALQITAQSVRWQLDFLAQVTSAIQSNVSLDPTLSQAVSTYGSAVANLKDLVGKLLQISKDRDAYWSYRLEREVNVRRMWEESMARVAREQEELERKVGESEEKRKKTKRALKDALVQVAAQGSQPVTPGLLESLGKKLTLQDTKDGLDEGEPGPTVTSQRRKSTYQEMADVADEDESDDEEEEFFDAVGAGDVEIVNLMPTSPPVKAVDADAYVEEDDLRTQKRKMIEPSFHGYEDGIRRKLAMDADDRPKISLWVCLPLDSR